MMLVDRSYPIPMIYLQCIISMCYINLKDLAEVKAGENGQDGRIPEIQVIDGIIKWRNADEDDSAWSDIISLDELKGQDGDMGEAGRGIVSIMKTASDGLKDIYTITYTDGTTGTFTVTNGQNGKDEEAGKDGQDGKDGQNGKDGEKSTHKVTVLS